MPLCWPRAAVGPNPFMGQQTKAVPSTYWSGSCVGLDKSLPSVRACHVYGRCAVPPLFLPSTINRRDQGSKYRATTCAPERDFCSRYRSTVNCTSNHVPYLESRLPRTNVPVATAPNRTMRTFYPPMCVFSPSFYFLKRSIDLLFQAVRTSHSILSCRALDALRPCKLPPSR